MADVVDFRVRRAMRRLDAFAAVRPLPRPCAEYEYFRPGPDGAAWRRSARPPDRPEAAVDVTVAAAALRAAAHAGRLDMVQFRTLALHLFRIQWRLGRIPAVHAAGVGRLDARIDDLCRDLAPVRPSRRA